MCSIYDLKWDLSTYLTWLEFLIKQLPLWPFWSTDLKEGSAQTAFSSAHLVRGELSWGRWSANIPGLAPQLLDDTQGEKLYNFRAARDKSGYRETEVSPCCSLMLEKTDFSCWHSRGAKRTLPPWKCDYRSSFHTLHINPEIRHLPLQEEKLNKPALRPIFSFCSPGGVKSGSSPQRSQVTCLLWAWLLEETSFILRSSKVPFRPHSPSVNTNKKWLDSLLGILYVTLKDSHSLHKPHKWPQKK